MRRHGAAAIAIMAALLWASCGKEKVYVYVDGSSPADGRGGEGQLEAQPQEDAQKDPIPWCGDGCLCQCQGKECGDDGCGGSCGKCAEGITCLEGKCQVPDLTPMPDNIVLPDVLPLDEYVAADTPGLELPEPDLPPVEDDYKFPEVTTDCEPLGLPNSWVGTFDGEVTSNIPDFAGYTFNGPVNGEISFEIKCINQKYVVTGELNGGATNCALPTGCPFIAKLGGFYNPQTQHMEGAITDAAIDYSAVIVYAEGTFQGDLTPGPTLSGIWEGEKTDIKNNLLPGLDLSWVEANGTGTWTANPAAEEP